MKLDLNKVDEYIHLEDNWKVVATHEQDDESLIVVTNGQWGDHQNKPAYCVWMLNTTGGLDRNKLNAFVKDISATCHPYYPADTSYMHRLKESPTSLQDYHISKLARNFYLSLEHDIKLSSEIYERLRLAAVEILETLDQETTSE